MNATTDDRDGPAAFRPLSLALLCGLVLSVGTLYVVTLAPSISGGDSGELTAVACELGVAHPPGYPLYTMLAASFVRLAPGPADRNLNLASALFGLGAVVFLFATLDRWLADPWAALLGSGLFAFSGTVWRYATVAEVFSFNNLLVALLTYLMLRFWQSSDARWAFAMALTVGIGVAHHHTIVFVALPFAVAVVLRDRKRLLRPATLGRAVVFFICGLLPYLYLPWASSRQRIVSWGDTTGISGFLDHVLRREYGTFRLASKEAEASLLANLGEYLADSAEQLLLVGPALALVGLVWLLRKPRHRSGFAAVLGATWLSYGLAFNALSNADFSSGVGREIQLRFWQIPNLFLCLLAAAVLSALGEPLRSRRRAIIAIVAVVSVAVQAGRNFNASDASDRTLFRDLGRATLGALPPDSILLTRGDTYVNAVRHLQACEGFRPDVAAVPLDLLGTSWLRRTVAARHPDIAIPGEPGAVFDLAAFVRDNADRPVLVNGGLFSRERKALEPTHTAWNAGAGLWLLPAGTRPDVEAFLEVSERYASYEPPAVERLGEDPWGVYLSERYWRNEQLRAEQLSLQPAEDPNGFRMVAHAASLLERMIERHPSGPAKNYRTLAFAYFKLGRVEPSYRGRVARPLRLYLERNPDDPDRATLEEIIRNAE